MPKRKTEFEQAIECLSDYQPPGWKPSRKQRERLDLLLTAVPGMTPARAAEIVQAESAT